MLVICSNNAKVFHANCSKSNLKYQMASYPIFTKYCISARIETSAWRPWRFKVSVNIKESQTKEREEVEFHSRVYFTKGFYNYFIQWPAQ